MPVGLMVRFLRSASEHAGPAVSRDYREIGSSVGRDGEHCRSGGPP
jgi:hypothetical protein